MADGVISKALSGFYYVSSDDGLLECKARGRFRLDGTSPLVGDRVQCSLDQHGKGRIDKVEPRRNWFIRPAVANIDAMVFVAANTNPVTDPFLIDRVIAIAEGNHCESIVCVNKCDLASGAELAALYRRAGYQALEVSAETGEGMDQLKELISSKVSAFTGNSGVGKSSILNALEPGIALKTGEVSDKLGRGRHTTRHVELVRLSCGGVVADTPGFSSFDVDKMELCRKEELAGRFREFVPYVDQCQFQDCAHVKEKGCAVLAAVKAGEIAKSRHESYVRLYEQAKQIPDWERK